MVPRDKPRVDLGVPALEDGGGGGTVMSSVLMVCGTHSTLAAL